MSTLLDMITDLDDPRTKLYIEQFFSPSDITNKNYKNYFNDKDLSAIRNMVYSSLEHDPKRRHVTPGQYYGDDSPEARIVGSLGGFGFKINEDDGSIDIIDKYDWGPEYSEDAYIGRDSGRNVGFSDIIKYLQTSAQEDNSSIFSLPDERYLQLAEMVGNAYGPREKPNKGPKTIVDALGIRPLSRNIKFNIPTPEMEDESYLGDSNNRVGLGRLF